MARSLSRRGRMKSDDERRMQINSLFIEHEVEAKDLAAVLYSSQIIDSNDRDEILGGTTRLERTRRMIDILLLRGTDAFDVFLYALDEAGYDHVASRLRTTEVMLTPKTSYNDFEPILRGCAPYSDLDPLIREVSALSLSSKDPGLLSERLRTFEASCLSLSAQDPGGLQDRLKKIEDLWDILSRRVTRIEKRVEPEPPIHGDGEGGAEGKEHRYELGQEELKTIKQELADLKTDTMAQVEELTSSNTQKAALIENLLGEVEEKTAQLQEAHSRIEELEQRIELLEAEKAKSVQEVVDLREELSQHKEQVKHQEDWFNAENLRLQNTMLRQAKALGEQEIRVTQLQEEERKMKQMMAEQQEDLKEQRRLMEEQNYQLGLLTKHMMTIANSNNNAVTIAAATAAKGNSNNSNNNVGGEDSDIHHGRDVNVTDDVIPIAVAAPPVATQAFGKPHTAQPASKTVPNKNHFNNHFHRTSFNGVSSSSSNPTTSNTSGNLNAMGSTVSSAVCLHVPASVQQQAPQYRAIKRSAPAQGFRLFGRKK